MIISLEEVGFYNGLQNQIDVLFITSKANDVVSLMEKSLYLLNENSIFYSYILLKHTYSNI